MNQPLVLVVSGIGFVVTAIGVNFYLLNDEAEAPSAPKLETASPAAPAAPAIKAAGPARQNTGGNASKKAAEKTAEKAAEKPAEKPTFDVVRVTPQGDAVIAGRAKPKSTVVIIDNGQFVGQLDADDRGEWVFVPDKPLAPGSRQFSLEQRSGPDAEPVVSDDVVIVVVPEKDKDIAGRPAKAPVQALALKFPRAGDGPSTVLQKPKPESAAKTLSVDTVDYDDAGRLHISGRGEPERVVQIYLDNRLIGRSQVDGNGGWRLKPDAPVAAGLYTLRADEVGLSGKVHARIELPFARAESLNATPPEPMVIVQPGNSLWRLARRMYGSGFRYTTIYAANRDQIKDPDMIFPGQVFAVPATN